MRVIAGAAKGRTLKAVPGMNTRPTTDKVKEAIFSMIGPFFDGGLALDLFAGTGGLGIEAWSRGIERTIFIDREKISIDIIKLNTEAAGMGRHAEIYRNDADRALKLLEKRGIAFSIVFLDPPYRLTHMDELMADLAQRSLLEDGATIVVEHDAGHEYPDEMEHFILVRKQKYGDTAVTIYRYSPGGTDGGTSHADE
ncbi:16S rRNA (guanine(966)-N(2))-methyltransferase RsmD [Paenibacillus sp. JDR-2]|uniref:16S rRNA (guanine(966)-N(2))-methyltransferase RsmD n=1 Tax=Paenibacillus sp. (strain JDR-2) TaxID=324057 RepID=UPI00016650AE|nr:16S rRNA (guanine(966)-N(2))-methyltransferase RsmD [Paenibacillus sp. JDR-2]ACT02135.1 methyltransferase [Paenibacillus sp. JDR-2]